MKTTIFIPKQINVGFQNRDDTYTKSLAYIIYFDEKGKLRKEGSWNNWRDKNIENIIYENESISGFVLNKKVGDYVAYWSHRQAYIRVYDPRGFEFEITVENLLYILENTNSIKGKGLEGEFVYGWSGADLVLIPLDSPDYKNILEYNKMIHESKKIGVKDLVLGGTYRTKQNEDYVYMGRFDKWDRKYNSSYDVRNNGVPDYENINKGKHHYFVRMVEYSSDNSKYLDIITAKSPSGRFVSIVSEDMNDSYAEIFDTLECHTTYSPLDESKDKYIRYTLDEVKEKLAKSHWGSMDCYSENKVKYEIGSKTKKSNRDKDTIYYYRECKDRWNYGEYQSGTLEEIYNMLKPMYKNTYLANGKLYREGK